MRRLLLLAFLAGCSLVAVVAAAPVPKQVQDRDAITKRFGTINDPKKDATFTFEGEKLIVGMPKATVRDRTALTVPHTMRPVSGDFVLQVTVSYPLPEKVPPLGGGKCAAGGLLIWDTEDNHVLFHRDHQPCGLANGTNAWGTNFCIEYNRGPKSMHHQNGDGKLDAPPVHLRLTREGKTISTAYSYDGKQWTKQQQGEMDFPEKVMVGVYAMQTTGTPNTVTFERFTVTPIEAPAQKKD